MASIVDQPPDDKTPNSWESWREHLAIALQGQYGTAKTWTTVSEQARDGWRTDAANIMASVPEPPVDDDFDCGHHSWAGLMTLLDEHWPDDIFPTRYEDDPKRDAGPRIVSLMRWVDQLQAKVRAVEVLHRPISGEDVGPEGPYARQICDDCDEYWPCATSRAMDGNRG